MSPQIEILEVHHTIAEKVADCLRRYTGSDNITAAYTLDGKSAVFAPEDEFGLNQINRLRFFALGVTYGLTSEVKNETE